MCGKVRHLAVWWTMSLLSLANLAAAAGQLQLFEAVKNRDKDAVRTLLLQKADVNARSGDGATALHWAVLGEDMETAEQLIRAGADVNAANDYGVTPLALACI